jgi:hypothetical protein
VSVNVRCYEGTDIVKAPSHSYEKRHFRLSACISETSSGQISMKFNNGEFYKICRCIPNFLKIGQKYRVCYSTALVILIVPGDVNSP